jgi:hypothetical protein
MEIDNPVYQSVVQSYAKEQFKADVKSTSLEDGKIKFNLHGAKEDIFIPVEMIQEYATAGQLGDKYHQEAVLKAQKEGETQLSPQDKRNLLNLDRLKYMKRSARATAFKKSGYTNHERPKGEFEVYSPTRKRNVVTGLASQEDAAKWMEKYQMVEPTESLAILKNNLPVKEQPGIKEYKGLRDRINVQSQSKGIRR